MRSFLNAYIIFDTFFVSAKIPVTTPDAVTHEFTFINADGRVFDSNGKQMVLSDSDDDGHPRENGWKMFDSEGTRFYLNKE